MAEHWIVVAPFGDYRAGDWFTDPKIAETAPPGSVVRVEQDTGHQAKPAHAAGEL